METRKLFFPAIFLLLTLACALPSGLSQPTAAPTAPASGTVLLQDDFSSPFSGWDQASAPQGVMDYDGGVYRFVVNAPDYNFWSTPGKQYTDTRIEVDTAALAGPDANRAGLVCRVTGEQFYFFVISSDGYFAVGRTNGAQSTLLGQDQMAPSANIRTGMAINHLRADCVGSTLTFFINGFSVAQVNDPALTSGEVGLLAGAFEEGGVDIIFDKFIVMQP
jgi:hypothetical protein